MRSFIITSTVFASLIMSASASELATQLMVRDLQRAEQVVAAAESSQDFPEMKKQADRLLGFAARMPDKEDIGTRGACGAAVQSLRNLADDLSEPKSARKIVSSTRERKTFLEYMPMCEEDVGLQPPATPNLRIRN